MGAPRAARGLGGGCHQGYLQGGHVIGWADRDGGLHVQDVVVPEQIPQLLLVFVDHLDHPGRGGRGLSHSSRARPTQASLPPNSPPTKPCEVQVPSAQITLYLTASPSLHIRSYLILTIALIVPFHAWEE